MYKVVKRIDEYIEGISQVSRFIRKTRKFGKRFYTMKDYHKLDGDIDIWGLCIRAIAISRELVFEITWYIECQRDLKLNGTWHEYVKREKPIYGLIPTNEQLREYFYPALKGYDDRFEYEGFIQVDSIEEISE